MTLKQFLKPDWRKIALTIILSLFVFFIFFASWIAGSAVIGISREAHCCDVVSLEECPYANLTICEEMKEGCEDYSLEICKRIEQETSMQQLTFYLVVIVINYIISCLIVWIYDKVKKKKR